MNVLVTGTSGRVGHYIVQELKTTGHQALGVDIVPGKNTSLIVDLTKSGEIYHALARAKADAVVHMGAWANAGVVPDSRTYGENVQGTFNLFQACADLGIKRIVSASSAQIYGFASVPPQYVRVDENHPINPVNSYALSKAAGEQAADYFVKNFGLNILSFRLLGIRPPQELGKQIQDLMKNSESGSSLLWTRTDARDCAIACRQAVEIPEVESGPYNITGARVLVDIPTQELIQKCWPDTEIRGDLHDFESPLCCDRAKKAFGYNPQYVWSPSKRHLES